MKIVSINIHDPNNLGDQVCNPCDYFDFLKDAERIDAWKKVWPDDAHLIFGGGGLLHGQLIPAIQQVPRNGKRQLIWWGAGHNEHGKTECLYENSWLAGFEAGIRDFHHKTDDWDVTRYEYIPCPSCMSKEFDEAQTHEAHGVVIYEHHSLPIPAECNMRLNNKKNASEFGSVIAVLAGASAVITNTYHGAYWGLLLGKRVAIYKPFSSRFYGFKIPVPFCDDDNIATLKADLPPSDYLQECRQLNIDFAEEVRKLVCA